MSRILVCKDGENLLLKKSKAHQYKDVDFTGVACGNAFELEDRGDKLVAVPAELDESEAPIYTIITNEFGLYAKSHGVYAKVKVSFCEDSMMIVDILEGAVLVKPDEEVLLASRNMDSLPPVDLNSILWVNADKLLSFSKYWSDAKSKFIQDFEYIFMLKGENPKNMSSFSINHFEDESIDISGGFVAVYESQLKTKEEAKQAKKGFSDLMGFASQDYSFDDDDDEEEEDSEDDEDDGCHY